MKRKEILSVTCIILLVCTAGCGDTATEPTKTTQETKKEALKSDRPVASFILDGRRIESDEYYCSWKLTGQENTFTFTIVYDREPGSTPPTIGFVIYNLENITNPFIRTNGKLPTKKGQQFSLSGGLGLPKGKPADLNEISFTDNYPGLESAVKLNLLDTTAKVVSGSFEGMMKNENGKITRISEGKFTRVPLQMTYK